MLKIHNWIEELDKASSDPTVGIRIARIAGDDHFGSYAAEILPGKSVAPHFHPTGSEQYVIHSGRGEMYTGTPSQEAVQWNDPQVLVAGDIIDIPEGVVHSLRNVSSNESLKFLFFCAASHMSADNRVIIPSVPPFRSSSMQVSSELM